MKATSNQDQDNHAKEGNAGKEGKEDKEGKEVKAGKAGKEGMNDSKPSSPSASTLSSPSWWDPPTKKAKLTHEGGEGSATSSALVNGDHDDHDGHDGHDGNRNSNRSNNSDNGTPTIQESGGDLNENFSGASGGTSKRGLHYYPPQSIAAYVQFYKDHFDNNNNNNSANNNNNGKKKTKKKTKKKHLDPAMLQVRRSIQLCCRDNSYPNDLGRALRVFRSALGIREEDEDGDGEDDNNNTNALDCENGSAEDRASAHANDCTKSTAVGNVNGSVENVSKVDEVERSGGGNQDAVDKAVPDESVPTKNDGQQRNGTETQQPSEACPNTPNTSSMVILEAQTFYNLLNLCSLCEGMSFGERSGVHVGTPRNERNEQNERNVGNVAHFDARSERVEKSATSENEDVTMEDTTLNKAENYTRKDASIDNLNETAITNAPTTELTQSTPAPPRTTPPAPPLTTPRTTLTLPQRLQHAMQIHSLLTLLSLPLIEPAYTALIRLAVLNGRYDLAEGYLDEAEGTMQCKPKLRMYSSLMRSYCGSSILMRSSGNGGNGGDGGNEATAGMAGTAWKEMLPPPTHDNLVKALHIWKRMYDHSGGMSTGRAEFPEYSKSISIPSGPSCPSGAGGNAANDELDKLDKTNQPSADKILFGEGISPKIQLTEYEYSSFLRCATALRDAPVMERLLSDLVERVLVPGGSTTEAILGWFRRDRVGGSGGIGGNDGMDGKDGKDGSGGMDGTKGSDRKSALDEVTLPPREGGSIGEVSNPNGKGWIIHRGCTVDSTTGILTLSPPESDGTDGTANPSNSANTANIDHNDLLSSIEYRLQPVELTPNAWRTLREMNRSIVLEGQVEGHVSQFQGGGKGKKRGRDGRDGRDGRNSNNNGNNHGNNHRNDHRNNNDHQNNHNDHRNNNGNNNNNHRNNHPNHNRKQPTRIEQWTNFETFLRTHPPYHYVIDGANVGYFQQNFGGAPKHVDYRQIDWLVRHVLEGEDGVKGDAGGVKGVGGAGGSAGAGGAVRGVGGAAQGVGGGHQPRVLLFLHERHFSPRLVPHWAHSLIRQWDGNRAPYDRLTVVRTPFGMNDDWFWMHAALLGGEGDGGSGGNGSGIGGGGGGGNVGGVLAITNDEMRDHHFQMLAQGSFLRWKERHQVHFEFGSYDKVKRRREVRLEFPCGYSRRIQRLKGRWVDGSSGGDGGDGGNGKNGGKEGNGEDGGEERVGDAIVIPLPKKGDEGRFMDGAHVAEEGVPEEETYVVVRMVV